MAGAGAEIRTGNSLPISNIPVGTLIHNIEVKEGRGGQMVRSAGGGVEAVRRAYAPARVLAGPERIETGWWDGDVRRDYYLVETSLGQRAWAFRAAGDPVHDGRADGFMLHGWFG